jgi:hypothetical protein
MKRNHLVRILGGFVVLLAILACALPGQTAQPASVLNVRRTVVALTSTAGALANLNTATPSPMPTETIVPTPKISSYGTSLINLPDGSMQFVDHVAGVQTIFPLGWLVFRVGEQEYYAAWEKQEMQNPEFGDIFATMQNADPKILRAVALDLRPGHMPNGILTGASIIFLPDDKTSLEEWEKTRKARHSPCVNYKFLSASYPQTANDTRVLVVEERCSAEAGKGNIYERAVYFSLPSGTLHIDLETNLDQKDATLLEFNQMVDSLTSITP